MVAETLGIAAEAKRMQPRILIADDQPDVQRALALLLKGHGYTTEAVSSPAELLDVVTRREFDLLLIDLNYARDTTSGREGLDLLGHLKTMADIPPIVVMTGWATVGVAVEAMQGGGLDFVEKPWDNTRLLDILQRQVSFGRERRESARRALLESQAHKQMESLLHQTEHEIAEARAIQEGFLPKDIPQLAGYEIVGAWQSARVVGGDYFDVLAFEGGSVGLCIADVAGKGMPAALLMSNLQAAVRGFASPATAPHELTVRLNSLLCRNMAIDRFITFFYAQLDGPTRELRYVNAGHNPPIVVHADGSHHRLEEGGMVLGVFSHQEFATGSIVLEPGDRLVLFTDGVTEAGGFDGEEFGESRLLEVMRANRTSGADELQRQVLRAASEFSRGNWTDDATTLVLAAL
jgi:phosphoserine phosphatase RsbU/P